MKMNIQLFAGDPVPVGYSVTLKSNDGTTTVQTYTLVTSITITSTGATLIKRGDETDTATYIYSGQGIFAGFASAALSRIATYPLGSTITVTDDLDLYIVDNEVSRFLDKSGLIRVFNKVKSYLDSSLDSFRTISNNTYVFRDAESHLVEDIDPSSISDLTGTTWRLNSIFESSYSADIDFTFTDSDHRYSQLDEVECVSLQVSPDEEGMQALYYVSSTVFYKPHFFNSWVDDEYRTIYITGGDDVEDADFISWLLENAEYVAPSTAVVDTFYNTIRTQSDNTGIFMSSASGSPLTPEFLYDPDVDIFESQVKSSIIDVQPSNSLFATVFADGDTLDVIGGTGTFTQNAFATDMSGFTLQSMAGSQVDGEGFMQTNYIAGSSEGLTILYEKYSIQDGEYVDDSGYSCQINLDDGGIGLRGDTVLEGDLTPSANNTYDLGSSDVKFRDLYATNLHGLLSNKLVLDRNSSTNDITVSYDNSAEVNLYQYYPRISDMNIALADKVDITTEIEVDNSTSVYTEILKDAGSIPAMVLSATVNTPISEYLNELEEYESQNDPNATEPEFPLGYIKVISPEGVQTQSTLEFNYQGDLYNRQSIFEDANNISYQRLLTNQSTESSYHTHFSIERDQVGVVRAVVEKDNNHTITSNILAGLTISDANGISMSFSKNSSFSSIKIDENEITTRGNIIPLADAAFDLGSSSYKFNNLYAAGNIILGSSGKTIDVTGTTNISGNFVVSGSITQQGASSETHAEKIYTTKDYIYLREGATTALATGAYTGFEFIKYDGTNNGRLVVDKTGIARVGDVGDEQPLATREESPINNGFAKWNSTNNRFETILPENITLTANQAAALRAQLNVIETIDAGGNVLTKDANRNVSIPNAGNTSNLKGVVYAQSAYGIDTNDGLIRTVKATDAEIDAQTHDYHVIVPSNLSYAIKSAFSLFSYADQLSIDSYLGLGSRYLRYDNYQSLSDSQKIQVQYNIGIQIVTDAQIDALF